MKQNVIEFRGDPMAQLRKIPKMEDKIFYLNENGLEEIGSYSITPTQVPDFFHQKFNLAKIDGETRFFLLATAGVSATGEEYPETYFLIDSKKGNEEFPYKILGMHSATNQYIAPKRGQRYYFKAKAKKIYLK